MTDLTFPEAPFSMQMVAELAAKIQEPDDILDRYGVSRDEFEELKQSDVFRSAYKEAKQFWDSDANIKERIAAKAAYMLEDSLLELHGIFHDASKTGQIRMDAFKQMTVLAKVNGGEQRDQVAGTGQAININIDMGQGKTMHATVEQPAIEGEYDAE
jgi:hypothetical protein